MADQDAASRRIMDELGEENRVPIVNVDEGDVYVLLGFPIGGLLIGGFSGVDALVFPLVLVGLALGVAAVYASPSHLSAATWLTDVYRHYCKRPRVTYSVSAKDEHTHAHSNTARNEGGLINYTPFAPDERTQDLTNIERAWPGARTVQRTDGTMEAFLQVDPGNMDFAMSGDWAHIQDVASEFANKELDYNLKFYTTTRTFPVEELITQIDERLEDDDVSDNPVFEELLAEYREQRPRDLDEAQQIRYYIGVQVNPLEVYSRYRDEQSPAEKLTSLPVIGFLFNPFVTRREDLADIEVRSRMFDKLDRRCRAVQTELVQKAPGWSARRLSTVELFVLAMDFWNGEEHTYDDAADAVREQSAVRRQRRESDE
ncbi:biotin transporter BioY [Natronolimnobius sp. AArcel1]|uniref:biotin transporter BioY n=1 Tax=Natronolimnobius sp. AArcel1 TaxID=1679093 RepID=UPI0013EC9AFC|nr:biotin transporter BioY [Natronolimnobius sp. AArcel1]NGM71330.1 biotin transporter BioY [Natronolimnobius sp. AArcel1]